MAGVMGSEFSPWLYSGRLIIRILGKTGEFNIICLFDESLPLESLRLVCNNQHPLTASYK